MTDRPMSVGQAAKGTGDGRREGRMVGRTDRDGWTDGPGMDRDIDNRGKWERERDRERDGQRQTDTDRGTSEKGVGVVVRCIGFSSGVD